MSRADRRLLSLAFLCTGAMVNLGDVSAAAVLCMVISVALAAHSVLARSAGTPLPTPIRTALLAGMALLTMLYPQTDFDPIFRTTAVATVLAIAIFTVAQRRATRLCAAAVAAAAAGAGLAANVTWGAVGIDVFELQQSAARALLNGHDPYAPVVSSVQVVSPGRATAVGLHFPYGPVIPVLEAPFRLLGDVRVLHALAAVVTAAAVLLLARRAGRFNVGASLLMAFPMTIGMIIFSWVDIITMAGLATWLVLYRSHPRAATVALAVALATKPTTLVALVPVLYWSVRARRQAVVGSALAALIVLPFAVVTGVPQFYNDVIGVFLAVQPRFDSLTVNSLLFDAGLPVLPFLLSAAVVVVTTVVVLRRRPATYGDVLGATAVIVTVSFLVAKWAYFNYYYIAAVLLVMAVAGDSLPLDSPEMIRPPAVVLKAADALRRGSRRWQRGRPVPEATA